MCMPHSTVHRLILYISARLLEIGCKWHDKCVYVCMYCTYSVYTQTIQVYQYITAIVNKKHMGFSDFVYLICHYFGVLAMLCLESCKFCFLWYFFLFGDCGWESIVFTVNFLMNKLTSFDIGHGWKCPSK